MHISTSSGYLVAAVVGLLINVYAKRSPMKISPIGQLFSFANTHRVSRFAFVFIWWWLGWHFLGSLQPI